jgi:hypothetical protein
MLDSSPLHQDRGIALVTVLLLSISLGALILGATAVSTNAGLIRAYGERLGVVNHAALAGLEEGRSRLNSNKNLYPDSGYVTLENGVEVRDADNQVIPGLRRWTYAGPSGVATGEYGIFGSIISVVEDEARVRVVRRLEITQESFARYAYFTDFEGGNIYFGGGDQIFGPLHSNDAILIHSSGARFRDVVTTAKTISGVQYGTFDRGYRTNVTPIPFPTMAELTTLRQYALQGGMAFTGYTSGTAGQARTRIEFVALDLNGDGDRTDPDEGFIRVYQGNSGQESFVSATRPGTITTTPNCGDWSSSHGNQFLATVDHSTGGHDRQASLNNSNARCYLGGDPVLTNGFVPSTARGAWQPWTGPIDPRVIAVVGATAARYLHPITRPLNPNFKGVIHVNGNVVISGTVRGRVTLAATGNIIIGDNIRQATDPSMGICDDILGLVSGSNIVVADNLLNAPVNTSGSTWKTMRPVGNQDEFVHAVILALNIFTVENYDTGPTNREACGTTAWGRGCLQVTGGIIQRTRGPVGTTLGTGNLKRYSYNTCAMSDPPPYFPRTGHFARNRFYELDPVGFDVAQWFAAYQAY